ncbi:CatB-related O-acetyltransferase [Spirosoma radiotolerans]|nr:CatB-related O-acetyltransferase [Spirosoma radiotolerans]
MANTDIGKFCSIGPNVVSGMGIHPTNGISTHPAFYSSKKKSKITYCHSTFVEEHRPVHIGNDVFIGANVTILDGVKIGDGAVIGAGSVVSKDIPPYAIAVGCPIKIIKYRFPENIIDDLMSIKWWNQEDVTLMRAKEYFYDLEGFVNIEKEENLTNI